MLVQMTAIVDDSVDDATKSMEIMYIFRTESVLVARVILSTGQQVEVVRRQ